MKKCLALLWALWMLLSFAQAEELLPLADQAAAAALKPESGYCGIRPMVVDASEDGDAVRMLGDVYIAQAQLDMLTPEEYARAQWMDRRAVVEMRRSGGVWAVTSFSMDAEWEMEQPAQEYFAEIMMEYINAEFGYSIQYPAVFGEDCITMTPTGIAGRMEGASFQVECLPNGEEWTTQTLLSRKKQEITGAETNMDIHTGVGCLRALQDGEYITLLVVATPERIYQASLCYDRSLIRDFLHYSEYMINSFSVDELGLG